VSDHDHERPGHDHSGHDQGRIRPEWAERLNNPRRLETQLSESDLARLLALDGHEDVIDLGSGTGFYTDRIAALTSGTVYAVELQREISALHEARGAAANVRMLQGDMTRLSLPAAIADVAITIATYHEVDGRLDLAGLAAALRPGGRLVIVDWRSNPQTWEGGPPAEVRVSEEQAAASLAPYFAATQSENLGPSMFAVVATLTPRR
jgi:SAM-dependent methyltransferase